MGKNSQSFFERAQRVLPGGVNSPFLSFHHAGGSPRFIEQAQGSRMFDIDNLQYIDCIGSFGPTILGHAHRYVVEAVKRAATRGFGYAAPGVEEVELAEAVSQAIPSIEMFRLVNSATEATVSTIRVARAATGRRKILKFDGCFHGDVDELMINSSPDVTAAGIPDEMFQLVVSVPFNDLEAARQALLNGRNEFAAIIVEPVASAMGCVPPAKGFLSGLRELCDSEGTLLIFDEVTTGFRVTYGGAQQLFGVRADLTTLGRIIGGGLPMAAFGGSRKLMQLVSPLGPVFQSGTLAGNPVAVAAGKSTLSVLKNEAVYRDLEERALEFETAVNRGAEKYGVRLQLNRVGSMWTIFFTDQEVTNLVTARRSNLRKFSRFFNLMLGEGVYLPPSQFEVAFFSSAHAKKDITQLVERTDRVLKKVAWEFES
jgi:glutamate-1-semialdehyde 2,1-aminomutase